MASKLILGICQRYQNAGSFNSKINFGFQRRYHVRPYVSSMLSCYNRSTSNPDYLSEDHKATYLPEAVKENFIHRLVLSAHPDEFEKLPPKCSSCGIILQTEDTNVLGYVPEMKLTDSFKENNLQKLCCYNCYRLKYHNEMQMRRFDSDDVADQLRHLRQRKALILYVVDMFDIEGTQFHKILSLIGKRKRIIIVGNKIDRLPQDDKKPEQQLEHMKDILKNICFNNGLSDCNFRDICLVSARTGFGLQILLSKINKHRDVDMDVYLVGCSNTGKSTLYNMLVNLLNVHKSNEMPAQAIEHHVPGTTNSLIRQDISMRRLKRMEKRLENGPWEVDEEFTYDEELLDLLGFKDASSKSKKKLLLENPEKSIQQKPLEFVNLHDLEKKERPCHLYDTPGIINESQLLRYLDPNEINYLSPTKWVVPRTFILKPGNCIFIGGLARLDYKSIKRVHLENPDEDDLANSAQSIYVTVMVSPNVPVHVTISETADEKFKKLFINNVLELPKGSEERFEEYPPLIPQDYIILGKNLNINACDFALHGLGWLSIAAVSEAEVLLALHTPNGIGQSIRNKPLLPYSVRKKEGRGMFYRGHLNHYMYGHTRKRSPEFVRIFQKQNEAVYSWKKKIQEKFKKEKYFIKEERRLKRLEEGTVLGKFKTLSEKEEKLQRLEQESSRYLKEKSS